MVDDRAGLDGNQPARRHAGAAHREHHRDFDEHADDRGKGRARAGAVEGDCGGNGQLEEVRSADEGALGAATAYSTPASFMRP